MSLRLEGLGKSYGAARVLDGVTLEAEPGDILALCGQNGAGKSTLVKVVAGAIAHGDYDGVVRLDGRRLDFAGPADAEAAGVSLLPQELTYYPELSVAENLLAGRLPARSGVVARRRLRARAEELCAIVDLDVDADTPLSRLETSGRQLVCIARALAADPQVLILDEPTAALPRAAAEQLFGVIRRYADEGRIVLYVSHHLTEVTEIATRVAVLRNGRLVLPPAAGISVREIVHAMVGEEVTAHRRQRRPQDGRPRLQVEARTLRRGTRTVLRDVAFDLPASSILGIAGLTGSGREALLRALAGAPVGRADLTMRVDGRDVSSRSPRALRRAGVSYVPDDRRHDGLLPLGNLWDNVQLGSERFGALAGWRRFRRERSAVSRALGAYAVAPPDPDARVAHLSGGNQQKALLARAGFSHPRILLLSEPTRGVDVGARQTLYELIDAAADQGASVVVSSGDISELVELCDRVLVLREGRMVSDLAGDEVTEAAVLAAVNGEQASTDDGGKHASKAHQELGDRGLCAGGHAGGRGLRL